MSPCGTPLTLPANLIDTTVNLAGGDTAATDVWPYVKCEVETHTEGEHAAHLVFVPGVSGRAVWAVWKESYIAAQIKEPCMAAVGSGGTEEVCVLFAEHPGRHTWEMSPNHQTGKEAWEGKECASARSRVAEVPAPVDET
ncbi:hypothetical protein ACFVT5_39960 [Streptomyces sp. NPDC058001]|uniref:hypothetical protein n=1 Tax=Streptomyces sp. NPDC058001 TaxID=3346300 RepID=UPI0036E3D09F